MFEPGKQNSDNILISIAVTLLILSGVVIFWLPDNKNRGSVSDYKSMPLKIIGKANLTIDFGNGNKRIFRGNIIENETFIDVLNQTARAGDFSYKLNEKSDLASIGELAGRSNKYWHWYLNGKKIDKPISKTTIKPDDNILIKYE